MQKFIIYYTERVTPSINREKSLSYSPHIHLAYLLDWTAIYNPQSNTETIQYIF